MRQITNSDINLKKWDTCPLGKKYLGSTDPKSGLPDGLGLLEVAPELLYAGELRQGRRQGRGFMLRLKDYSRTERYYHRFSYEQVMRTADFDSCGRVTHTGPGGEWRTERIEDFRLEKEQDGMWEDDVLVSEVDESLLHGEPWIYCALTSADIFYRRGAAPKMIHTSTHTLAELEAGGVLKVDGQTLFVSPYGDDGLLVVTPKNVPPSVIKIGGKPIFTAVRADDHRPKHLYALHPQHTEYVLQAKDCQLQASPNLPMVRDKAIALSELEKVLPNFNLCKERITVVYPDDRQYWFMPTAELIDTFGIKEALEKNIEAHDGYMIDEWQFVDKRQQPIDLRSQVKLESVKNNEH